MTPAAAGLHGAGGPALAVPPPRSRAQVFPARPEQVGAARRFVAGLLAVPPSPPTRSSACRSWLAIGLAGPGVLAEEVKVATL